MGLPESKSPRLSIYATADHTVVVSWPSPSTGWSLQQTSDLSTSNWTDVTITPLDDGTTKSVVFDLSLGSLFLRLKQ